MRHLLLPALLLTACHHRDDEDREDDHAWESGADGIYLATFRASESPGWVCTTTITENVSALDPLDAATADIHYTNASQGDDMIRAAQLIGSAEEVSYLNLAGSILPGGPTDEGWRFAWDINQDATYTTEHVAGYTFFQQTDTASSTAIDWFAEDADLASGTLTLGTLSTYRVEETDVWTGDALNDMGSYGQLPLSYLDNTAWTYNDAAVVDCDADPCFIELVTSCEAMVSFSATRVKDPAATMESLAAAVATGGVGYSTESWSAGLSDTGDTGGWGDTGDSGGF